MTLPSIVDRALPGKSPDDTTTLSPNQVHDVLSNERRRYVIRLLADDSWQTGDLATSIAAHETDQDSRDVTDDERKRAYVSLYQTHLPKLHSLDVIDWPRKGAEITQGAEYDGVYCALQAVDDCITDHNWGDSA